MSESMVYGYQWSRSGVAISGATSSTYMIRPADAGAAISCAVTATNSSGSAAASTAKTLPVTEAAMAPSLTNVSGIVLPGYANASDYAPGGASFSTAEALPGLNKSYGMNWIAIQTTYTTANWSTTDVTARDESTLSDDAVVAMVAASKTAGLKVCLKPHCTPADGSSQAYHMPGTQLSVTSFGSTAGTARYSTASSMISTPGSLLALTSDNVGDRVVALGNPFVNNLADIPNSAYRTQYATGGDPDNSTVRTVVSPSSFMLGNAAGDPINPAADSSTGLIGVIHESTAAEWFANWQSTLLHLLSLAAEGGGADAVNTRRRRIG